MMEPNEVFSNIIRTIRVVLDSARDSMSSSQHWIDYKLLFTDDQFKLHLLH